MNKKITRKTVFLILETSGKNKSKVQVKRRLKAKWTKELTQQIANYHNLNIEEELIHALAQATAMMTNVKFFTKMYKDLLKGVIE